MQAALEQARAAFELGEVPVGAAIGRDGRVIAVGHNEIESAHDATLHAEIVAIRRASVLQKDWRLNDTILCVTLEPCTMCAGAIRQARIPVVAFGATDPRFGAFGSIYDLSQDTRLGSPIRVIAGIQAQRCTELLTDFFKKNRSKAKASERNVQVN
ncbi:MAG: nucleoside deaminase [Deltaproteobacteria bacterium]|nr:nucleoside deaminase [Deltaproteobacteria bacterium]